MFDFTPSADDTRKTLSLDSTGTELGPARPDSAFSAIYTCAPGRFTFYKTAVNYMIDGPIVELTVGQRERVVDREPYAVLTSDVRGMSLHRKRANRPAEDTGVLWQWVRAGRRDKVVGGGLSLLPRPDQRQLPSPLTTTPVPAQWGSCAGDGELHPQ